MVVFGTLEDLRGESAVHEAVVVAIRGVHDVGAGGNGATVTEIMGETAEQRRGGRVRYVVVAEAAPCGVGAARVEHGGGGGGRREAHQAGGQRDGGGDDGEGAGVLMLPVVGGARDRESSRARGEMMPQVTTLVPIGWCACWRARQAGGDQEGPGRQGGGARGGAACDGRGAARAGRAAHWNRRRGGGGRWR